MDNRKQIEIFLRKHNMFYEDINMAKSCDIFIEEMGNGLKGNSSTLKMIPTYISLDKEVDYGKNVIVIDAGGTNFRVGLVQFKEDKRLEIDYLQKYPMPGAHGEITKDEFFEKVVEYLSPIIEKSNNIGFCFSYPTEILPNKDGKLIHFNKEVKVSDMVGEKIGEYLMKTLKRNGYFSEKRITIINDTVATLLGGLVNVNDRKFDSYIGFILGTGTNTCYVEENRNIKKNELLSGSSGTGIINIESGGYGKFQRSDIDENFDEGTEAPKAQWFEKMISGAYQGGMVLAIIKQAAHENLFKDKTAEKIERVEKLESMEIDDFCNHPYGMNILAQCVGDEIDREKIYFIIDAFFERAARLSAINLAAVMLKNGKGKNPCKPVCISVEGSTFYKSKLFKSKLDCYVADFMNRQLGIWCELVKVENATIIGTAVAGILG